MQTITTSQSEAAIWTRLLESAKDGLSPEAARSLLALTFSAWDKAHMNELARKNQQGLLSAEERQELESYVKVGDVLSLLQLKARQSLQLDQGIVPTLSRHRPGGSADGRRARPLA